VECSGDAISIIINELVYFSQMEVIPASDPSVVSGE
jgi:hypothetical protein